VALNSAAADRISVRRASDSRSRAAAVASRSAPAAAATALRLGLVGGAHDAFERSARRARE